MVIPPLLPTPWGVFLFTEALAQKGTARGVDFIINHYSNIFSLNSIKRLSLFGSNNELFIILPPTICGRYHLIIMIA